MGFAYDIRKAEAEGTREARRLQKIRNVVADGTMTQEEAEHAFPSTVSRRPRKKMRRSASPENKMLDGPPEDKASEEAPELETLSLDDVPWASPQAKELAEAEGLNAGTFAGREYSGATGFTTADVRDILEE
jgi:hypothetical protein